MQAFQRGLHELLCRVAQKDEAAFIQMYDAIHRACVAAILGSFSSLDENEAEAIFNQAMFKIWQRADTYQGRAEAEADITAWTWIRVTLQHTAQDVYRKSLKTGMFEVLEADMRDERGSSESLELSPLEILSPRDISPAEKVIDNPAVMLEYRQGWLEFLASLNERERQIVRLRCQGLSQAEIAASLNIGASRLSQIMSGLRRKAQDFFGR